MPSSTARQRNNRARDTVGGITKPPISGRPKGRKRKDGDSSRLQSLLYILVITTVLLLGYQLARFYYRGQSALSPMSAWTKAKYGAHDSSSRGQPFSPGKIKPAKGETKFNKLAPEGAVPGAPALVPGQEASDVLKKLKAQIGQEGELDAQFDEDGNLDMATIQRMMDILYKPAKDGAYAVKKAGKVAGKVMNAMVEDEVASEAADHAEVEDESAPY